MVGDAVTDMEMGQATVMDTIAVTWGAHPVDVLAATSPSHIVDNPAALTRYVDATWRVRSLLVRPPIAVPDQPGGDITVTGFTADDAYRLFSVLDDDEVWAHIAGARPGTSDELTARLTGVSTQQPLVIRRGGAVVGTSSFHFDPADPAGVEIGSTLLSRQLWGTGVNTAVKQVMLAAAFGAGAQWVQLRTDERNARSAAAILKLPGVVEIESRVEPQWIRADGTVRTSRMFRVQ